MSAARGGLGVFTATVWPTYVAFGNRPDEVVPADQRAQIYWAGQGSITGRAQPITPPGEHGYLLLYRGPIGEPSHSARLEHPYRAVGGPVNVGPIYVDGDVVTAEIP